MTINDLEYYDILFDVVESTKNKINKMIKKNKINRIIY